LTDLRCNNFYKKILFSLPDEQLIQTLFANSNAVPSESCAAEAPGTPESPGTAKELPSGVADQSGATTTQSFPKNWTNAETKSLIMLRVAMQKEFEKAKKHKTLWEKIASEIGVSVTGKQCENKFKSMKRDYRNVIDNNNGTGNGKITCPFFNELSSLFGHRAASEQPFTISSTAIECGTKPSEPDDDPSQGSTSEVVPQEKAGKKRKRKCKQPQDDPPEWLERYETTLMQQLKEMHADKMNMMERFLKTLEKNE
jgi:hypothetical protein